jgi:hypothetical protein
VPGGARAQGQARRDGQALDCTGAATGPGRGAGAPFQAAPGRARRRRVPGGGAEAYTRTSARSGDSLAVTVAFCLLDRYLQRRTVSWKLRAPAARQCRQGAAPLKLDRLARPKAQGWGRASLVHPLRQLQTAGRRLWEQRNITQSQLFCRSASQPQRTPAARSAEALRRAPPPTRVAPSCLS